MATFEQTWKMLGLPAVACVLCGGTQEIVHARFKGKEEIQALCLSCYENLWEDSHPPKEEAE
ncbi:hypothetical protein CMI37_33310 [Candidatus Pacearchaeota archaeon]|nr:hypothetical protein [Candidatus Pacearchaeota archaeon]|tara:strand:- start:1662 stop:1847 length:186 start_codon:yes stop_codon:yes gene_type:complete